MRAKRRIATLIVAACMIIAMMIPMTAFAAEGAQPITDVKVTVQTPKIGDAIKESATVVCTPSAADAVTDVWEITWYKISEEDWNAGSTKSLEEVGEGDVFEEGYVYNCDISVETDTDLYYFTENTTVTINGKPHNDFWNDAFFDGDEEDLYPSVVFEHKADTTKWESDANNHWNTCDFQDEKYNEGAHTFAWKVDKEATATTAVSKHEECTVCGYAKDPVEIPATGTDGGSDDGTSPKTGDTENAMMWLSLLLASGVALTCTTVLAKKRK